MKQGRPTIDDVAELSGVARVTVSRVLNDGPNVSEKVRERVLAAVEKLGYSVNLQARMLAKGTSRTILIVFGHDGESEPNSYYHSAIEVGALRGSAPLGLEIVTHSVATTGSPIEPQIEQLVAQTQAVGVILTPPFSDSQELIARLRINNQTIVCISPGQRPETPGVVSIGMDDEAAGHAMATHLLQLGHRVLGYIAGRAEHASAEKRLVGTRRALAEHGFPEEALTVLRGDFTFRAGVDLTPELLAACPRLSAIMCANDDTAVGALFAAHRAGLRVPEELSISGFDDTPISGLVWPPLTTIHQPIKEMSELAARLIAGGTDDHQSKSRHHSLPFALISRASTSAASG